MKLQSLIQYSYAWNRVNNPVYSSVRMCVYDHDETSYLVRLPATCTCVLYTRICTPELMGTQRSCFVECLCHRIYNMVFSLSHPFIYVLFSCIGVLHCYSVISFSFAKRLSSLQVAVTLTCLMLHV